MSDTFVVEIRTSPTGARTINTTTVRRVGLPGPDGEKIVQGTGDGSASGTHYDMIKKGRI